MDSSLVALVEQVDGLLDDVACPIGDVGGESGMNAGADAAAVLSDDQVRQVLVGLEQVVNRAQALQGQAMVEMGRRARAADRAEVADRGEPIWSRQCRETFVADEIGVLLGCTKMAATVRYDTACRAADLPVVAAAWRAGLVDARKVAVIAEQVSYLPPDAAHEVAGDAVEYATRPNHQRTAPQLREWLRRKVIAADPAAAEERRQRAMGDRRVVITPGEDGMAELWALLPAVQGRQIQNTLTDLAHQMGASDARSMDQRRTDSLVDLLLGRAEPPAVNLQVIVAADTITGASSEPGWVPGLGPVTATEVDELIRPPKAGPGETGTGTGAAASRDGGDGFSIGSHVSVRRLLTDPSTGTLTDVDQKRYRPSAALDRAVRTRDVTCRFPGCRRSADSAGTDLDHTVPWPVGPTAATNLAVLCRRHHRLKHTAGWNVRLDASGVMTWTTPTGRAYVTHPWQYLRNANNSTASDPDPPLD